MQNFIADRMVSFILRYGTGIRFKNAFSNLSIQSGHILRIFETVEQDFSKFIIKIGFLKKF